MTEEMFIDKDGQMKLLGQEVMRDRREYRESKKKVGFSDQELERLAKITIKERIKFCKEKKEKLGDSIDIENCTSESIQRWVKLFKDSKDLGKHRVDAVEKLFEKIKKDGTLKSLIESI
jgi:hypothetical protein